MFTILYIFYVNLILFELFKKTFFVAKTSRVPPTTPTVDFHENLDTSESQENWYLGVLGHVGHESGTSFLISKT